MNDMLVKILNKIDDIKNLREVLEMLRYHKLMLRKAKLLFECTIYNQEVEDWTIKICPNKKMRSSRSIRFSILTKP